MKFLLYGRRAPLASWAVFLLLSLATGLAAAQDAPTGPTPKVFMLPTQSVNDSITSIVPERIGEQVRGAVQQDGNVVLMPTYEEIRKQLGGAGHSSAAIAEAEGAYTSGIGLLTAGEDQKAAEAFQKAVDLMEQNIGDVRNFEILADALSNLALAYHNAGFDVDAKKHISAFAHLRPEAKLDAEKYPKAVIKELEKAQRKVKKGGPGKLAIKANVEGAKVFIDGVEKGAAPMTVNDVGFGYHYLVVRSDAGAVHAEKIRVKGRGKSQKFDVKLGGGRGVATSSKEESGFPAYYTDLVATVKSGRFGTDLQPYTKEVSKETGADFVAWIVMFKDSGKYNAVPFAYSVASGKIVQGEATKFNIELSDLRVGVSEVSKALVDLVVKMPADKEISSVVLGPAPMVVAAASPSATPVEATTTETTTNTVAQKKAPPPSEETSTWTYVAAGGAVLVVGALIAGGVYLLVDDDNPDRANGFDAVVSW